MSATSLPKVKMTVTTFHDWVPAQPQGRYELVRGEIIAMAPGRLRHVIVKGNVARVLREAVKQAKLPCTVFTDGVSVVIDDETSYGPDAVIDCGSTLNLDSVIAPNPMIVVEVTSPSSERNGHSGKVPDYMTVAGISHVLIIDPLQRRLVHHARGEAGVFLTWILREGDTVVLEPPGVQVAVAGMFEDA